MKLQETIDFFLGEYKLSTQRSYYYVLKDFAAYMGHNRPLSKITNQALLEYGQSLNERESIQSPVTFNKYVKTLRTFFNWCVRNSFIKKSPASAMRSKKTRRSIPKERAMTEADFTKLLDYCQWNARANALVRFLADTGCRIGGAASLKREDLHIEEKMAWLLEKTNSEEPRPVFFGDDCARALQCWLDQQPPIKGSYVFSSKGAHMTNDSLGQFFTRTCERAGIGAHGPHKMRHRWGHRANDEGVQPQITKEVMGHAKVETTLDYYYPRDVQRVKQAVQDLSADKLAPPPARPDTSKIIQFPSRKIE